MKNIMCKAEARHIVQFIMGIALDLFSYNAPATTCIEEEKKLNQIIESLIASQIHKKMSSADWTI